MGIFIHGYPFTLSRNGYGKKLYPLTGMGTGGGWDWRRRGWVWSGSTRIHTLRVPSLSARAGPCTSQPPPPTSTPTTAWASSSPTHPIRGEIFRTDVVIVIQSLSLLRASLVCRISNCRNRNRNRNRNLIGMQVKNYKGKIPSKKRKNEVRLNCFLGLFCIGIGFQRKIS
jgi:hypothetical protein